MEPKHICPHCRNEIDPEVCWCGDYISGHPIIMECGHGPIPMGCECGRVMGENRFALVEEDCRTVIRDVEHGLNFLFLAEAGMGVPASCRALAQRIVDFLNSLPKCETLIYPHLCEGLRESS